MVSDLKACSKIYSKTIFSLQVTFGELLNLLNNSIPENPVIPPNAIATVKIQGITYNLNYNKGILPIEISWTTEEQL